MADYEDFLYDKHAFADTHPDLLYTLGSLFGMQPAPIDKCRVLELGCGLGGNLIPLGELFPESEFVGVDLSVAQIAVGQAEVRALGLGNVHLHAMDILALTPQMGRFDYILCHGVYSWVPPAVQDRILAICRVHLAPQGIAYVSYNTLPGWHVRGLIRDVLRRHATATDPVERVAQARELAEFIHRFTPAERSHAAAWLKAELGVIGRLSDAYVLYEHLVEVNTPCYFKDFVTKAAQNGLQYVADAEFSSMSPARYGPEVAARIEGFARTLVESEQYLDYLTVRFFRRSLLCHHEVRLNRKLTADRLAGRVVTSRLKPSGDGVFRSSDGMVIDTQDPLIGAALQTLSGYPQGLRFEELCVRAAATLGRPPTRIDREELGGTLLELFATGGVLLGTWKPLWTPQISSRPKAARFSRHEAAHSEQTTNLRHQTISLDPLDRAIIRRLDGRSRQALYDAIVDDVVHGVFNVEREGERVTNPEWLAELVDQKLERIAAQGLLLVDEETDTSISKENIAYVLHRHDRDHRQKNQHADPVDEPLELAGHGAAGDGLDADEHQPAAVEAGERQQVEQPEVDAEDGHEGEEPG
ncbi:MAG: class I SAM-dependent methyltransferase [Myxococcales bacterium]|nr:class I SAM-dependent methyltransferase [Myxococcales bacterium]